jgi:hypothetical protein
MNSIVNHNQFLSHHAAPKGAEGMMKKQALEEEVDIGEEEKDLRRFNQMAAKVAELPWMMRCSYSSSCGDFSSTEEEEDPELCEIEARSQEAQRKLDHETHLARRAARMRHSDQPLELSHHMKDLIRNRGSGRSPLHPRMITATYLKDIKISKIYRSTRRQSYVIYLD